MSQSIPLQQFVEQFADIQCFWMLTDAQDHWATLESERYMNTDVIPVWCDKEAAAMACEGDWKNFRPRVIKMPKWFSVWLPQLTAADVLVGVVSTDAESSMDEIELTDFTGALVRALGAE